MSMLHTGGYSGSGGGGGGVHNQLLGREDPNCHSISSVTGLANALSSQKYRGPFFSAEDLAAAHPTDVAGAYATVIVSGDASMYVWNDVDGEWQDSGVSGNFVETVNGQSGPNVNITAADIGAQAAGEKGIPGGYPSLDGDGRIPQSQLPTVGVSLVHGDTTGRDLPDQHPIGAVTGLQSLLNSKLQKQVVYSDTSWETWRNEQDGGGHFFWAAATGTLHFSGFNSDADSPVVFETYAIDGGGPNFATSGGTRTGTRLLLAWSGGAPGNGSLKLYYTEGRNTPGYTADDEIATLSETRWELAANKTTSLDSASTDAQYPSAKAVWDVLDSLALGFFKFQDTVFAVAGTSGGLPGSGASPSPADGDVGLVLKDDTQVEKWVYGGGSWSKDSDLPVENGYLWAAESDGHGWYWFADTWNMLDSHVSRFTNTAEGLIKGDSATPGRIRAEADGTGSVNGWDSKEDTSEKGAANGYAPLGADAKVPAANLPALPEASADVKGIVQFATDAEIESASPPAGKAVSAAQAAGLGGAGLIAEIRMLPYVPDGWLYANGQVLSNADTLYPALWTWLGAAPGSAFAVSLSQWNTQWNAIAAKDLTSQGLCGLYVRDTSAKTIKVPDLRGAYLGGAGYDGASPGGVSVDTIRNITAYIREMGPYNGQEATGAFYWERTNYNWQTAAAAAPNNAGIGLHFDASHDTNVSTGNKNAPRTLHLYPCVCAR